jgi:dienelactone hydrolase
MTVWRKRLQADASIFLLFAFTTGLPVASGRAADDTTPTTGVSIRVDDVASFQTSGIKANLPVFSDNMARRLKFLLSWNTGGFADFGTWRRRAREAFFEALLLAPPATDFAPVIIAEEDRGTYIARKVVLQLTGDSRVLALMTVPKGSGPFPAVLLLHDHGSRFDIGKEKVIRPFTADADKLVSAREWTAQNYGGRFLGDELAQRGYVCFSTDALNWSDRGGGGYAGQQAVAGNLLNLGSSFAGLIAWEDLRAVAFLREQPIVDRSRIAAMGWSMGGFRAWQVASLSDDISASISVCWMSTTRAQMAPGSNQTRGQSAYTMTHPGISRYLDYPDLASIACPKPALFFAGRRDDLFTVDSVEEAFAKMRAVWASQGVEDRFEAKIWDAPHVYNAEMQDMAFGWLDRQLGKPETTGIGSR